jgi:hypothetical protein
MNLPGCGPVRAIGELSQVFENQLIVILCVRFFATSLLSVQCNATQFDTENCRINAIRQAVKSHKTGSLCGLGKLLHLVRGQLD